MNKDKLPFDPEEIQGRRKTRSPWELGAALFGLAFVLFLALFLGNKK